MFVESLPSTTQTFASIWLAKSFPDIVSGFAHIFQLFGYPIKLIGQLKGRGFLFLGSFQGFPDFVSLKIVSNVKTLGCWL